jgi:hypothetical protein
VTYGHLVDIGRKIVDDRLEAQGISARPRNASCAGCCAKA